MKRIVYHKKQQSNETQAKRKQPKFNVLNLIKVIFQSLVIRAIQKLVVLYKFSQLKKSCKINCYFI